MILRGLHGSIGDDWLEAPVIFEEHGDSQALATGRGERPAHRVVLALSFLGRDGSLGVSGSSASILIATGYVFSSGCGRGWGGGSPGLPAITRASAASIMGR